jgi:hypothetical protein
LIQTIAEPGRSTRVTRFIRKIAATEEFVQALAVLVDRVPLVDLGRTRRTTRTTRHGDTTSVDRLYFDPIL